jgi:hypothetical protein
MAVNNRIGPTLSKAVSSEAISQEELGFIQALIEKFRGDLDKKTNQLHILTGEMSQLRANENVIVALLENMIAAAERDRERREAAMEIRDQKDISSVADSEEDNEE